MIVKNQMADPARSKMYSSREFEDAYTYTGDDLGAVFRKDSTMFKVWAPTAERVKLNLYKSGASGLGVSMAMKKGERGVWSFKKSGNLDGVYYTYSVTVDGKTQEACDPYAKALGVNGDRAMVIDLAATNPDGWDKDRSPWNKNLGANENLRGAKSTDAVIYELHVRDFSIDESSGIQHKGKYLGLIETGTVSPAGHPTGIDYIRSLGVTHVHLNPVYDYQTVDEARLDVPQYNWGYDPKNYNVPEGSYATDPYRGDVRVREFKQMVKGFHDNGICVILDVVYNHTNDLGFCFNRIVPEYFYRVKSDGSFSSGSECGNDVASERSMVSTYIVDSVLYWAKEYHVDGFRFDLVGLTNVDTINRIRKGLDQIDPSILMYGEGWKMKTFVTKSNVQLATQKNAHLMPGMAMFNDSIRDILKGRVFFPKQKGWINGYYGKKQDLVQNILGLPDWSTGPADVVNYASCHDNLTLWDKINSSNPKDSKERRIKQNLLAAAIIHTAQGIPFMLAGEEVLRSKADEEGNLVENSYDSPDSVNSFKWSELEDADIQMALAYYKGLIAFRKTHAAFRMTENTQEAIAFVKDLPQGLIAYSLFDFFVIYNAYRRKRSIDLPNGDWEILIQGDRAGTEKLGTAAASIEVEEISCTILKRNAHDLLKEDRRL